MNVLLLNLGKKITGTQLTPNTHYLVYHPSSDGCHNRNFSNYFFMSTRVIPEGHAIHSLLFLNLIPDAPAGEIDRRAKKRTGSEICQ